MSANRKNIIKGEPTRVPQQNLEHSQQSIKGQPSNDGRGKLSGRDGNSSKRALVPFTLTPERKMLTQLAIMSFQGVEHPLATEEQQLKAIADIYPVAKSINGFKENKRWSINSSPAEVLHSILTSTIKSNDYEEWDVELEDGRYCLKVTQYYGCPNKLFIPINFLAKVNRSHPRLHELLIYTFRILQNIIGVESISTWVQHNKTNYQHGHVFDWVKSREEELCNHEEHEGGNMDQEEIIELQDLRESLDYYSFGGIPQKYAALLRGLVSVKKFEKTLSSFLIMNEYESVALPFMNKVLELAKTKYEMHEVSVSPWESGEVTPNEYMSIVWTDNQHDTFFNIMEGNIDQVAECAGSVPFCWKVILNEKNKSIVNEYIHFCDLLLSVFDEGKEFIKVINNDLTSKNKTQELAPKVVNNKTTKKLIDIL